ncbi:MAG: FKBP-type peptidyl-prolyl cis-trans isomerase [Nitrososphaerota archaeon]|nr:peptidylprolyl isomerase [Nitrososphaerota archaeon]MDG6927887.1 FKBP-type peptidyl-prolyl cis-trans isomerase [Nitrososphaerota archaeon]MDG6931032.1 FKBP-type peptidyl-prolyl cis-trans isomerase [Nitrososphaerota archaeon]MDG6932108.1 FKBP-type peptidyl-prolyl cis-trans isomerase [Nitrososphaerota archaeon]MDG6936663.1 FKBP-type peptidyl-prolyl cis-trans isomerase [Nitrososphaerota archaeon]
MQQGSLILLNYTARIKETGDIIETTVEDVAKTSKSYKEGSKYKPSLVALGKGWVLKSLDDELLALNVGDKKTIELPPEKAFGSWNPTKVRIIPLRKFGDKAKDLQVGAEVEIDNQPGTVISIGSGRVQVDFNDRLAGKTIIYDVEVVKELTDMNEKVANVLQRRIDVENPQFTFAEGILKVELPPETYLMDGLQYLKRAVANDCFALFPEINEVQFSEKYQRKS